jgi:hypothetical protein
LDCWEFPNGDDACVAGILLPAPANPRTGAALLAFDRHGLAYYDHLSDPAAAKVWMYHCWSPAVRGGHLRRPEPAWLHHGTEAVEVAGVTAAGQVYASQVRVREDLHVTSAALDDQHPFLAVTLLRPGLVAAVTRNAVLRLRREGTRLRILSRARVPLGAAVACFPHATTRELLVVCQDGTVLRLPLSG